MGTHDAASRFSLRSLLNASAMVFAATMVLNIGGFAFHAIASRKLGVDDYGTLYSLISLYSIAVMPLVVFTSVIARYAAEFRALHDDSHVRGLIDLIAKTFLFGAGIYVAAALLFAVPLGSFLHVAAWQIPVVGVTAALGVFSAAMRSVAQGVHDYAAFSFSSICEGILKVLALALCAFVGLNLLGGIASFVVGMAGGAIVVGACISRSYLRVKAKPIVLDWRRIVATTSGAASLTVASTLIGAADVLIVKHFFSTGDAGLYSAAALCARILFYFVGFIPVVLIPQVTHRHVRGERTRPTLFLALSFVAVVAICGALVYAVAGSTILNIFVGGAFAQASGLLSVYAVAMALLALTGTIGSYALATHRLAFSIPLLCATIGTLCWISFAHTSLGSVVTQLCVGTFVMFMTVALPVFLQSRPWAARVSA